MKKMREKPEYKLVRSDRKSLAIQITQNGETVVRAPRRCPQSVIDAFVMQKKYWIGQKVYEMLQEKKKAKKSVRVISKQEQKDYLKKAQTVFAERVQYYAQRMEVSYCRITLRDQKTRWGSCSSKQNLNFNWRLIFAPPLVLDYVVVHELAHLREMNHSARFYAVVEQVMPDYKTWQRWLRENGKLLQVRIAERDSDW